MQGRKTLALSGIMLLLLALLPLATAPATSARQEVLDKIEPLVLEEITLQGQTDYFIWMTEKADLSPADDLPTKEAKGRFVYEALVATAERTQAPLRAYLDAQGVDYQAFYIANKILVRGGGEALLLAVAARPDVAQVTANHIYQGEELIDPSLSEAGPQAIEPNLVFVNADDAWAMGYTGQGTVLAANDTGLDWDHPAIINQYRGWDGSTADHNYNWWDATGTFPDYPGDDQVHGTAVTGIMVGDDGGANQVGMAPGAQTIHCKNADSRNIASDATIAECFQWDLAPWDLSGANPRPDLAPDVVDIWPGYAAGNRPDFRDEIQALHAAGILVAVPGSGGPDCASLWSMAEYWEVVTVGGVTSYTLPLPGVRWELSGHGPSRLDPTPPHYFPDVMAPSVNVRGCLPGGGYGSASGNCLAAPHVAGLIGLIGSACPNLRGMVDPLFQLIADTAVPLTGQGGSNCGGDYVTGPNNDWGYGTIDALAAVQAALALCGDIGNLDGHIADDATALPIAGATVENRSGLVGGLWRGQTDGSGYYTITTLAGSYTVTASAYGYYSATVSGVEVITGLVTIQDFNLPAKPTYLISGTVTEAGTGAPLSATVTVLETPLAPAQTDPATGHYTMTVAEGRYTFRVDSWGHDREDRLITVDGDQNQDFSLEKRPCILLVDDARDGCGYIEYYTSTLDHLGYTYDICRDPIYGPAFTHMDGYGLVLWFSGDLRMGFIWYEAGPNWVDELHLASYLDSGGTFLLSSQDYLFVMGVTSFGQDYLGVSSYSEANRTDPVGTPGDPIGDGLGPFTLVPPPGWQAFRTDNVDGVQASPFFWLGTGMNNSTAYISDTFRTVFFAWPLEGLADLDDRSEVLWRVIDWLGGCGCYQPVEAADFAWMPITPTVGQPVTFTGTAQPWTATTPISYSWKLEVGSWQSGSVVTHSYSLPGTYPVVMTATNCGGVATATHAVIVACDPVEAVAIAGPTLLLPGETGLYTATYTPPTATLPVTFTWSNGSTDPTAAYSWTVPGTYTVTVTATNPCGEVYAELAVVVCDPPSGAAFSWEPITPTVGESVTFTGTAAGWPAPTYDWAFGDGGMWTGPVVEHTYTTPGSYTVTMTATNACGTDAVSHPLTILPEVCIPLAEVTIAGPAALLVGEAGHYTATAAPPTATLPITHTWECGLTGPTAVYSWSVPGTYTLTVTATNPCLVPVTGHYVVEVQAHYEIYLPLVIRP